MRRGGREREREREREIFKKKFGCKPCLTACGCGSDPEDGIVVEVGGGVEPVEMELDDLPSDDPPVAGAEERTYVHVGLQRVWPPQPAWCMPRNSLMHVHTEPRSGRIE